MDDLVVALQECREKLKRCIRARLDVRLRSRLDESDVVQEVCLEAHRRFPEVSAQGSIQIFPWLRSLTLQRVSQLHRYYFGTQSRDATLDEYFDQERSGVLARQLMSDDDSPSIIAIRGELTTVVKSVLEQMDPIDRDVIAMRHFEMLSNDEVAEVTGLTKAGASNRYVRAMMRLRDAMRAFGPLRHDSDE